jgi:predicted Rossmann-fold nucleotide-binding protein
MSKVILQNDTMMQIARSVLSNGGNVKGWIPKFLMPAELSGEMVGETEVTETMSERKSKIFEASDA